MKGVVVTTDNQVEIRDFGEPLYKTVGEAVGGYIEIVHPMGLVDPLVMIVNEEGLLHELPVNLIGSLLYGAFYHGQTIVGNIVVMKEGMTIDGPDLVGLEDGEAEKLAEKFKDFLTLRSMSKEKEDKSERATTL